MHRLLLRPFPYPNGHLACLVARLGLRPLVSDDREVADSQGDGEPADPAPVQRGEDRTFERLGEREELHPVVERIAIHDRTHLDIDEPRPFEQGRALAGEEWRCSISKIGDFFPRTRFTSPSRLCPMKKAAALLQEGVGPRQCQGVVDVLHGLEARDEAVLSRFELSRAEDLVTNERPDVVRCRGDRRRRRLDPHDVAEARVDEFLEERPVAGADVDRPVPVGEAADDLGEVSRIGPAGVACLLIAVEPGIPVGRRDRFQGRSGAGVRRSQVRQIISRWCMYSGILREANANSSSRVTSSLASEKTRDSSAAPQIGQSCDQPFPGVPIGILRRCVCHGSVSRLTGDRTGGFMAQNLTSRRSPQSPQPRRNDPVTRRTRSQRSSGASGAKDRCNATVTAARTVAQACARSRRS